jgi:hypothetical protein
MRQFNSGYEIWGFLKKIHIFSVPHYFDPQNYDPHKYLS